MKLTHRGRQKWKRQETNHLIWYPTSDEASIPLNCTVQNPHGPFKSILARHFCHLQQEESCYCTFVLMSGEIQLFKDMKIINGQVFEWRSVCVCVSIYMYFFNLCLNCVWLLRFLDCLSAMLDCVSQNNQNVILDYALDPKEGHKNFVLKRIFQHSAFWKAVFAAYPISSSTSSCWANSQISN